MNSAAFPVGAPQLSRLWRKNLSRSDDKADILVKYCTNTLTVLHAVFKLRTAGVVITGPF